MKSFSLLISGGFFLLALVACKSRPQLPAELTSPEYVYRILPHAQPGQGDPAAGFHYLTHGNYIGGGIPSAGFKRLSLKQPDTILRREGMNAYMPYMFNQFEVANGAKVVSGNCFVCHASPFQGKITFGLGNSLATYTQNLGFKMGVLKGMVKRKVGKDSPEWAAFQTYAEINRIALPQIVLHNPGVNPAFRLEEAYASQRDPLTLRFTEEKTFEMTDFALGSDVPPLWNVKKKQALYYNGMGRGNFPKMLMQASTQGIADSTEARQILAHFEDVLAWIYSLEAPVYPGPVDQALAQAGENVFEATCSKCHGSYGARESYPNKIVPMKEVQTDPLYAQVMNGVSSLPSWYNESWFAKSPPYSEMKPSHGYIAPPLDGVWATAPYLHNGSVPDLESLLYSPQRPDYWARSYRDDDYNLEKVGWNYQVKNSGKGKRTYDATLPGYGNQGHFFGDSLSGNERRAVLEYLKTL